MEACVQLTQEFFRENTLRLLIIHLPKLNLERLQLGSNSEDEDKCGSNTDEGLVGFQGIRRSSPLLDSACPTSSSSRQEALDHPPLPHLGDFLLLVYLTRFCDVGVDNCSVGVNNLPASYS